MADESYTFAQARTRLEEIVVQVRKKDVSLEKSLDLLEEGVRLANVCTELSDHTEWRAIVEEQASGDGSAEDAQDREEQPTEPDADERADDDTPSGQAPDG